MARTVNPVLAATKAACDKLTTAEFTTVVNDAVGYGWDYATQSKPAQDSYPCGFAQLNLRLRKNDKRASILTAAGFRWDDYSKVWYLYGGVFTNYQNVDFKENILEAAAKAFEAAGIPVNVSSRWD